LLPTCSSFISNNTQQLNRQDTDIHNSQPLVPILSQTYPIDIHTSYLKFVLMLPYICCYVFNVVSYPHVSLSKLRIQLLSLPFVPQIMPILSTSISSPENYFISTNHEALTVQLSPVSHYFPPLLPFLSAPFSKCLNLCSSLNVKFQRYILITITTTKSTCININYDISYVFYMILLHAEGS